MPIIESSGIFTRLPRCQIGDHSHLPLTVLTTFGSAAAGVTSRFLVSDIYTSSRSAIEKAIGSRNVDDS